MLGSGRKSKTRRIKNRPRLTYFEPVFNFLGIEHELLEATKIIFRSVRLFLAYTFLAISASFVIYLGVLY